MLFLHAAFQHVEPFFALAAADTATTWRGHSDAITGVAFSQDGARVATIGIDGRLIVWDPSLGRELLTLRVPLTTRAAMRRSRVSPSRAPGT